MTTIKKTVLFVVSILMSSVLTCQTTDNGIWYEAGAEKNIYKNLRFDFEASVRTDQNATNIEKFYLEPGLRYKFNDYFAAGIYYRFIEQQEDDGKYYPRHRMIMQLKAQTPSISRFTVGVRYRVQRQIKTYIEDTEDEEAQWLQRLRFEVNYNVKGIPLEPYFSTEIHSELFNPNEYIADKWRTRIGIEYTLNKKHTFGIEYIYNDSRITKPAYMNLLGLTYSIKL